MELKLIKEEKVNAVTTEEVKFNFYKNIIKKDLEIACWSNGAIKVFGEFQIYSDHRSELGSFDQIVSFLTGKDAVTDVDTVEAYIGSQCSEYFMDLLILKETKMTSSDFEELSTKFTNYILEATAALCLPKEETQKNLKTLDHKYLGASGLGTYNCNGSFNH